MFPIDLSRDPVTTSWMLVIALLFAVAVLVPLLRLVAALILFGCSAVSGDARQRRLARRLMPRIGHLLGGILVGTAAVAAPAVATPSDDSAAALSLDRDGASPTVRHAPDASTPALTASPAATSTEQTAELPAHGVTAHHVAPANDAANNLSLDRDGGTSATSAAAARTAADTLAAAERAAAVQTPATSTVYVVRPGDSLWGIAQAHLDEPTAAATTEAWKAIWRANRAVIGDDPALIHPGQHLQLGDL